MILRMTAGRVASPVAEWIALPLVLITPFAVFCQYQGIPIADPAFVVGLSLLALCGFGAEAVARLRPDSMRPAMYTLFSIVFLDLSFREPLSADQAQSLSDLPNTAPSIVAPIAGALVLMIAVITFILRRHLGTIFTVIWGTMLVTSYVLPPEPAVFARETPTMSGEGDNSLPLVVHLVFDEHIGIEGIPTDIAGGEELKRDLISFYERYGFRLFGGAFTEHANTLDSLYNLVNGTHNASLSRVTGDAGNRGFVLDKNAWFALLDAKGYAVRVYQTDYLNFCATGNVHACRTFPGNGFSAIRQSDLSLSSKTSVLLQQFFSSSFAYRLVVVVRIEFARLTIFAREQLNSDPLVTIRQTMPWRISPDAPILGPAQVPATLDMIARDVAETGRGSAIFAHLLLPHYSYVLDRTCSIERDPSKWSGGWGASLGSTPQGRRQRYVRYFEQVRCLYKKMDEFLQHLAKAGLLENAVVVLHGDHGSRIVEWDQPEPSRDNIDKLSTLFAIRRPNEPAGYDPRQASVQTLFSQLLLKSRGQIDP